MSVKRILLNGIRKVIGVLISCLGILSGVAAIFLSICLVANVLSVTFGGTFAVLANLINPALSIIGLSLPAWMPGGVAALTSMLSIIAYETGLLKLIYNLSTIPGEAFGVAATIVISGCLVALAASLHHGIRSFANTTMGFVVNTFNRIKGLFFGPSASNKPTPTYDNTESLTSSWSLCSMFSPKAITWLNQEDTTRIVPTAPSLPYAIAVQNEQPGVIVDVGVDVKVSKAGI